MPHQLIEGDARDLRHTRSGSAELVIADPPYGVAKKNPKTGSLREKMTNRMALDYTTFNTPWDIEVQERYEQFPLDWMIEARRVLHRSGSIFICISFHRSDTIRKTAEMLGLRLISIITWCKSDAPPSLTRRQPTQSTELILWYARGKNWIYNYDAAKEIGGGKQLRDFWLMPKIHRSKAYGWRSQKPVALFERIVRIASEPSSRVVDPFLGAGTTLAASHAHGRCAQGYEIDPQALDIAIARLTNDGVPFHYRGRYDRIDL